MTEAITFESADGKTRTRIREAVLAVEPDAELILFGSRARGTAYEDSDWDIIVLVSGKVTEERKRVIRYALYDAEFELGEALVSIIKSKSLWRDDPLTHATALYQNVQEEGIKL